MQRPLNEPGFANAPWQDLCARMMVLELQLRADGRSFETIIQERLQLTRPRVHVYAAAVDEEWATESFVSDLTDRVFEGSTARLVLRALSSQPASKSDLDQIKKLLAQLEESS